MKVYYRPSEGRGNQYVDNMVKAIKNNGFRLINQKHGHNFYPMIFLGIFWVLFTNTKIFHFNWIVNNYARENNFKNRFRVGIIKSWIKLMKSAGAKFVWTLHNKKPHDLKNSKLAEEFRNFLLKECDRIVIHSINSKEFLKKIMGKEIENKIFYIPHGNYIKNYNIAVSNLRDKYNLMKSDFVFLYFGIIRPYKNLSVLIEVFKQLKLKRAKLLICGNPLNGKIENEIKSLCKDKNIILDMRFIKEQEVNRLFKTSDVVVLPYDKTSVLNSGTVLLSYSLKTPVIIPEIASIKSIKSNSFIFSYDYKNSNEHYRNLKKILRQTYKRYYSNRENLKIKGEKGYKFVKENNNWEIIEKRIGKLYNSLI